MKESPSRGDTTGQGRTTGPNRDTPIATGCTCSSHGNSHNSSEWLESSVFAVDHGQTDGQQPARGSRASGPAYPGREGGDRLGGQRPRPEASKREAVTVRWAVGADACGAVGCRRTTGLLKVLRDGESRVLCHRHAPGWCE